MTERLLLVDVIASDGDVEAEQVLVRASAEAVEFRTDDGTLITFDRRELTTALDETTVGGRTRPTTPGPGIEGSSGPR